MKQDSSKYIRLVYEANKPIEIDNNTNITVHRT